MLKCWSSLNGGGIFQIHRSLSRFDSRWPPMICDALTNYDLFVFILIVFFVERWRNFQAISRSVARHLLFFQPTHGRGALLPKKK